MPHLTHHNRKLRQERDALERVLTPIILAEYQRVMRALVLHLRRVDKNRPQLAKAWDESKHPRDKAGEFSAGGGSGKHPKIKYASTAADIGTSGAYLLDTSNNLIDMGGVEHADYVGRIMREQPDVAREYFNSSDENMARAKESGDNPYRFIHDPVKNGFIRIRYTPKELNIQTKTLNPETMRRIQALVDEGKIPKSDHIVWEGFAVEHVHGAPESARHTLSVNFNRFMVSNKISWHDDDSMYIVKRKTTQAMQKAEFLAPSLWTAFRARMRARIMAALRAGTLKLTDLMSAFMGKVPNIPPVKLDSKEIARAFDDSLGLRIKEVEDGLRREVSRKVVTWYNTPDKKLADIVNDLTDEETGLFSRSRAERVARTEITRLNSLVQEETARQVGATEWWWSTRNDQSVCRREKKWMRGPDGNLYTGCRELHGRHFSIGQPMPPDASHPNCRCNPVLVIPDARSTPAPIGAPEVKKP